MSNVIEFTAVIHKQPDMDAAYIEIPKEVDHFLAGKGRMKVKALFDGHVSYQGSVVRMGHPCYILGITKEIRQLTGKSFGDTLLIVMQEDVEERVVSLPKDVAVLLSQNNESEAFFNSLPYTHRKEYVRWIESAVKADTRAKRVDSFLERMKNRKRS